MEQGGRQDRGGGGGIQNAVFWDKVICFKVLLAAAAKLAQWDRQQRQSQRVLKAGGLNQRKALAWQRARVWQAAVFFQLRRHSQ